MNFRFLKFLNKIANFKAKSYEANYSNVVKSRPLRTRQAFLDPYLNDPQGSLLALKTYDLLSGKWSPFVEGNFSPHLEDNLEDDYAFGYDDLEDLLSEILIEYDLPRCDAKGNNELVITVKDLIDFSIAVSKRYPKKSDAQK